MSSAQWRTGLITLTSASQIVIGTASCDWVNQVTVGNTIKRDLDGESVYTIGTIVSATRMYISSNYTGDTGSGLSYQINRSFTSRNYWRPLQGDADWAEILSQDTIDKIDTDIQALSASVNLNASSIQVYLSGLTTVNASITNIRASIDGHDANIDRNTASIVGHTTDIANIITSYSAIRALTNASISRNIASIGNIRTSIGAIRSLTNASITRNTASITNIRASIDGHDKNIDRNTASITANKNSITRANASIGYFKEEFVPVEWGKDASLPPTAAADIMQSYQTVVVREFAGDTTDDKLSFVLRAPNGIQSATIQYQPHVIITATAPAGQGMVFGMKGHGRDYVGASYGTEILASKIDMLATTYPKYSQVQLGWSNGVLLASLVGGKLAFLEFIRRQSNTDDDYPEEVGIAGFDIKWI